MEVKRHVLLLLPKGDQKLLQFRSAVIKGDPVLFTAYIQFLQGYWDVPEEWTTGLMNEPFSSFRLEESWVDAFGPVAGLMRSTVARHEVLLGFLDQIRYQLRDRGENLKGEFVEQSWCVDFGSLFCYFRKVFQQFCRTIFYFL